MVLPPGATMTLPFESAFRRDEHEIAMLSEGDLALAVVVYFEYLDVAGARHTTQSAYRYDYESKKLVAHQEHNKMT